MKTIFILITNGILVRNILYTDIFKKLQEKNLHIVVFMSKKLIELYGKELNYPNVIFEEIREKKYSILRNLFSFFISSLITSKTAYLFARYGKPQGKKRSIFYFCLWYFWSHVFGRIILFKKLFRKIEDTFFVDNFYGDLFNKYNPDLVFSASILQPVDMAFIKEAKRRKIKTVGMPKSWDTLDKFFLRTIPDKFIVQSRDTREILNIEQCVPQENIFIGGFPQFDIYSKKDILDNREEFLKSLNLDPLRKVIFFGSGGFFGLSDDLVAEFLSKLVNSNELILPCSLIIRPHFLKRDINTVRFDAFKNYDNVFVDNRYRNSEDVYKYDNMFYLANLLNSSDITINSASTLTLDAACLDKPIICVALKNAPKKEFLPKTSFYKRVIATGEVRIITSMEELKNNINKYLSDPFLEKEEREILRQRMCHKIDGKSGERIANFLLNELNNANTY